MINEYYQKKYLKYKLKYKNLYYGGAPVPRINLHQNLYQIEDFISTLKLQYTLLEITNFYDKNYKLIKQLIEKNITEIKTTQEEIESQKNITEIKTTQEEIESLNNKIYKKDEELQAIKAINAINLSEKDQKLNKKDEELQAIKAIKAINAINLSEKDQKLNKERLLDYLITIKEGRKKKIRKLEEDNIKLEKILKLLEKISKLLEKQNTI
jgi:hypothetical protein